MDERLLEIADLVGGAGPRPTATALPRVLTIQGEVPEDQLAALYEPMIGLVVRGGKTITIGDRILRMEAPSYFVLPTEVPATGRVSPGRDGRPYLSVGLHLCGEPLSSLLEDLRGVPDESRPAAEFSPCSLSSDFLDAWLRFLRLLRSPEHIPALAPVYEREILYQVLLGPQGWRLRQLGVAGGHATRIRDAVRWMRENPTRPIDVGGVAAEFAMSVTTFHRRFKQVTGLSPVQFHKQLRLLEARKLLTFAGRTVSEAAHAVGYESTSQFHREYARFFGASPARDARELRRSIASPSGDLDRRGNPESTST